MAEFSYQFYSPVDLALFYKAYHVQPTHVTRGSSLHLCRRGHWHSHSILNTHMQITKHGLNYPELISPEANLDLQLETAMSPGVPTTFWSVEKLNTTSSTTFPFVLDWAYQVWRPHSNNMQASRLLASNNVSMFVLPDGQCYEATSGHQHQLRLAGNCREGQLH